MKKKNCNAYFTVEATFIIPMVLLLIVLMIQYGFFCYEKSLSLQCCYLAALRASNEWELTGKEIENFAASEMENLLEERALYPINRGIRATITLIGLEVEMQGNMEILFWEMDEKSMDVWEVNAKKSAAKTIPSEYIRKYKVLNKSGGENNGNN